MILFDWEFWVATAVLLIALSYLLMLLRFETLARQTQELEDTVMQLCGVDDPRKLLEGDLPPNETAAKGGE